MSLICKVTIPSQMTHHILPNTEGDNISSMKIGISVFGPGLGHISICFLHTFYPLLTKEWRLCCEGSVLILWVPGHITIHHTTTQFAEKKLYTIRSMETKRIIGDGWQHVVRNNLLLMIQSQNSEIIFKINSLTYLKSTNWLKVIYYFENCVFNK